MAYVQTAKQSRFIVKISEALEKRIATLQAEEKRLGWRRDPSLNDVIAKAIEKAVKANEGELDEAKTGTKPAKAAKPAAAA